MSFIASMVAAAAAEAGLVTAGGLAAGALGAAATGAAGAGLGAGISAATGGDPAKGALMGGIGGLGAGAGAALGGASMGADAIGAEGAAATPFEAAVGAPEVVTAGLGPESAPITGQVTSGSLTAPSTTVATPSTQTASTGINGLLPQTPQAGPMSPVTSNSISPADIITKGDSLTSNSLDVAGDKAAGAQAARQFAANPETLQNVAPSDIGWGQQLLNKAGVESQLGSKIGGQALENAVYGAGINGLMAGAQGQDVGKAMGIGALSGGVGGAAAEGLGQMGGAVGEFATAHPMITSGAIGMGTNMALNGLTMPSSTTEEGPTLKSPFRYNPASYRAYLPHGNSFGSYAAGGITDLDNYDAAPNQPTAADPGTLNIPNRGEVANNEGYTTDAVRVMAHGGISDLGSYSDGGRLLKGPGDGVSDDIPATIGGKQPARLAEGEFVIPSRIVSELGNGSTDAGAKRLYQMMDRIQADRRKTTGKGKFSDDPKAYRHLPA